MAQQTTVKLPRSTYVTVKALAKKKGCFIGKVIADAVALYISQESKAQVA